MPPAWKGGQGAEQAVDGQYATHGYRGAYGTGSTDADTAVELLLRTARRDGARVLSPIPSSRSQAQGTADAGGGGGGAAEPVPPHSPYGGSATAYHRAASTSNLSARLPSLPGARRPSSAGRLGMTAQQQYEQQHRDAMEMAKQQFSVQSFMVHAATAQPESFRAHSRLVSRLNQVRTTFLHYQSIFQKHEEVFQRTWGRDLPPPDDLDARKLLTEVLPKAQHSAGLELTTREQPWPLRAAGTHNYGTSRLADGSDVTNPFRQPARVRSCSARGSVCVRV